MERVASWVTTMATATHPTINSLLRNGLDNARPLETQLLARHAAVTFDGVSKEDDKIRSSIFVTAALAMDPRLEPVVAFSATDVARPFYWSKEPWKHKLRFLDLDIEHDFTLGAKGAGRLTLAPRSIDLALDRLQVRR